MNTLIKVIVALVLSIFLTSCNFYGGGVMGNGNIITQERAVTATFKSVKATEGVDVYISQSATASIKIEADDNIIDLIETEVNNGELVISTKENIGRASKKVYVSLSEIERLATTSGADLESMGTLKVDNLDLDASSGSDLVVEVQATAISADASSGADIEVFGVSTSLNADASSGSDIKAERLNVETVSADASSGANIKIGAVKTINYHKSSGGGVSYKGTPEVVEN
ncbi:head GIN domain-containing protein [Joostella sp. CR20]|uniref:head GIN domain-containing protein n=1 Tax=Joostella sp. CR20 TaxID=2804312 RepID=UPI00313B101C